MFRWALYIPMSLIDSDTVTSNLVSRTEVREVRRLCVEGTRGYCVCVTCLWLLQLTLFVPNIQCSYHVFYRRSNRRKILHWSIFRFWWSFINTSAPIRCKFGTINEFLNHRENTSLFCLLMSSIRIYRFRGSSCLFYFKETWSRINARRKVNSGYDQMVRRYSWDDSRIRRSIWLTDFQEVRRRLNIFLIVIYISTRSSLYGGLNTGTK